MDLKEAGDKNINKVCTEIELENFHFVVSNVDNRRIEDIQVKIINKSAEGLI